MEDNQDLLSIKIVDIEVALDICNNISAIITVLIDAIQKSSNSDEAEVGRLSDLRWYFLRTVQTNFTVENIDAVREFIARYSPAIKEHSRTGAVPEFLLKPTTEN